MSILEISRSFLYFFIDPPQETWLLIIKIIFISASGLLLFGIIFSYLKSSYLKWRFFEDSSEFLTFKPSGVKKLAKTWDKIKSRLDSGLESEYKLAVIEADGLMEDVLRKMGFKGENLEERLNTITSATISNIEELKSAHHSRTQILHNPDSPLPLNEAKKILEVYERALEVIQAF